MPEAEVIKLMWFQPWHIMGYLFVVFVLMVLFYEWRWANTCSNNIQVLVAKMGGGGDFQLAPKSSGGQISLTNPNSNTVRTWPINELATIEIPYPGVGFVPTFLQKTIRLAIVNEGDWEPMLNRSPHMDKIASPDIVEFMNELLPKITDQTLKMRLEKLLKEVSTGPTREMIASPAVLGNLINEKITEAVMTVNKEIFDRMEGFMRKLNKLVNPMVVYIGLGLALFGIFFIIYQLASMSEVGSSAEVMKKLDAIEKALGGVPK